MPSSVAPNGDQLVHARRGRCREIAELPEGLQVVIHCEQIAGHGLLCTLAIPWIHHRTAGFIVELQGALGVHTPSPMGVHALPFLCDVACGRTGPCRELDPTRLLSRLCWQSWSLSRDLRGAAFSRALTTSKRTRATSTEVLAKGALPLPASVISRRA